MILLDAINISLRAIGHSNIMETNTKNPNIGHIRDTLDSKRRMYLASGLWFNTLSTIVSAPQGGGQIHIPYNALAVYAKLPTRQKLLVKDGYLYNPVTGSTIWDDCTMEVDIILDLEFEALPETAATAIAYEAAYEVYMHDLGFDNNCQMLMQSAATAKELLSIEHIRQLQGTAKKGRHFRRMNYRLHI